MVIRFTILAFAAVLALSISAALFRVATAPERIAERRATAKEVCVKSGGVWVREGRDEICRKT
ncbi:MAG: hypothetical protein JNJ42_18210 [Burkholderiaceae bacterium]|jgi:hypothetical protein|nr:hypothetical protein [Burkholderiaceae bacterium]